jgi:hypothetical protein
MAAERLRLVASGKMPTHECDEISRKIERFVARTIRRLSTAG